MNNHRIYEGHRGNAAGFAGTAVRAFGFMSIYSLLQPTTCHNNQDVGNSTYL